MTGTINPELPEGGGVQPRGTSDAKLKGSLITLRDALNGLLNSENKVTKAASESGLHSKVIATEESRENTAYGTLTTADEIKSVVMPENGLFLIGYQATWKATTTPEGCMAAVFLGANQLKQGTNGAKAPVVQEAVLSAEDTVKFRLLSSFQSGLVSAGSVSPESWEGNVTTGQTLGHSYSAGTRPGGSLCAVFAAAGTYDISVKFKASSGAVKVKERKLWVAVLD